MSYGTKIGTAHDDEDYFLKKYKGQNYGYAEKKLSLEPMIYDFFEIIDFDKTGVLSAENIDEAADMVRIAAKAKHDNTAELNYKHMPAAVADVLSGWDADHSGSVGISELIMAAEAQKKMKDENRLVKRLLVGAVVVIIILLGATFGLSITAAELAKDSKPDESGIQKMGDGKPVAMGAAKESYKLQDFASLSSAKLKMIKDVSFVHKGEWHQYAINSIRKTGKDVTLGVGSGQYLEIRNDKTMYLDGVKVDPSEGRRLLAKRQQRLLGATGRSLEGSGDGQGSPTMPPYYYSASGCGMGSGDGSPTYYYAGSPSGCGYGDGSPSGYDYPMMGSGSGSGSGCTRRKRRLMSCYDELMKVDMNQDGMADMGEMMAYDPCFDPQEMEFYDLTGDGILDAQDCQAEEEMMAQMMSDAMEPSCGGQSEANDMGSGY